MKTTRPLGTLDVFGADFLQRKFVCDCLERIYQSFGYDPLQTPALEFEEVFTGHHGEGEKLLFHLRDSSGQKLVLRYDLTVPFARFAKDNPNLSRPIKRYQMQMAYRDDAVDKGHFREFMQCDGDIIGSNALYYDADVINLAVAGLSALGFTNFIIRVNHRDIIKGIAEEFGYKEKEGLLKLQRALDCADKFGKSQSSQKDFALKLTERNFSKDEIEQITSLVFEDYDFNKTDNLLQRLKYNSYATKGIAQLSEIISYLPRDVIHHCQLDLTLARGADYYTGFILEGILPNSGVGAVLGGGRYDNLVRDFGGFDKGCVGMAFGLDRICVAMKEAQMFPKTETEKILIASPQNTIADTFILLNKLRANNFNADMCLEFTCKEKALEYAQKRHFTGIIWNGKYFSINQENSALKDQLKLFL